jgi:nucleoid-associated protein YgaU
VIPANIRNNSYYLESLRLTKLAQDSYDYGDFDASTNYANEAIRYAQLSDEYVALQLKIKETNDAIAAAKQRLDWASSSGAAKQYPIEFSEAQNYYGVSLSARSAEDWDRAIDAANRVVNILAYIQAPDSAVPLPAQYTVRAWAVSRDCLWNIAGRPWAYGDPAKWRLIYNANKAKMPQPDNPDLIHPNMVLDIPSIKGEIRQGMWDAGKTYSPLQ